MDFLSNISSDPLAVSKILGAAGIAVWLFLKASRLLGRLLYIFRGLYWKSKKVVKQIFRLLSPAPAYQRRPYGIYGKITRRDLDVLYQSLSDGTYRPWRFDYLVAAILAVIGFSIIAGATYWYSQTLNPYVLSSEILAIPFLYIGLSNHENGQRRKHGKVVEATARTALKKHIPQNWDMLESQLYDYGDIDILLRLADDSLCPIEVKSWHSWKGYRCVHAVNQALRQRLSVKASIAIIWLPDAPHTPTIHTCGISVVRGKAKHLVREIQKKLFLKTYHDIIAKFPRKPPESVRKWLVREKFKYISQRQEWVGRKKGAFIPTIHAQISEHHGTVTVDQRNLHDFF